MNSLEALKTDIFDMFKMIRATVDITEDEQILATIENQLLQYENYKELQKAQATEKELAELKEKTENFIINYMAYPYNEDGIPYANDTYTKDYVELLNLCKGSENK